MKRVAKHKRSAGLGRSAKRRVPPSESPCRVLSLVLSFASKESTTPLGAAAPPPAPESARQSPPGQEYAPAGTPKGFPRGKQSARFALPCAPLVVCLNSGSLTAFGGCIHWIPASLRSPLETFGHQSWQETEGTVTIALADKYSLFEKNKGGLSSKRPSLP